LINLHTRSYTCTCTYSRITFFALALVYIRYFINNNHNFFYVRLPKLIHIIIFEQEIIFLWEYIILPSSGHLQVSKIQIFPNHLAISNNYNNNSSSQTDTIPKRPLTLFPFKLQTRASKVLNNILPKMSLG